MIHFRLPKRRSTRLTPPASVPTTDKADEMLLQDTLQVSLVEHKSHEEQEARENVALVNEHLATTENDKLVDDSENVRARSDKESPEVEITKEKEVEITKETEVEFVAKTVELTSDKASPKVDITKENKEDITNIVPPVNVDDEEDEITDEVYELKRREKGKDVEESRNSPIPTPTRSPRNFSNLVSSDTEKLQELTVTHTTPSSSLPHTKLTKMNRLLSLLKKKPTLFKRYKSFFHELQERYGYLFAHLRERFMPRKSSDQLADDLHDVIAETLPSMVKDHVTEQVKKQVPKKVRDQVPVYVAKELILERQKINEEMQRMVDKAILQECGNIQAQISSKIHKAIADSILSQVDASVRSYMSRHILHVHSAQSQTASMKFERTQVPQTACRPSAIHPRDQEDPHDDAHPEGENSAKRQKTSEYEAYVSGESSSEQVNEEEPGLSTSGNQEHDDDFHFWTDSYASDDDEIPTKQVSQDIMEEISLTINEAKLKKMVDEMLRQRCTSGDEHQYHIDQMKNFLQSDIVWESRKEILDSPHPRKATPLVLSCQRNPDAPALSLINQDLLYLKKGNSRPEKSIVSITEPYYKNLNKNDIEDLYLLIMNGKVPDYADTGLQWSLSVFIRSSVIWERVHDFQLGIESYQQKVNLTAPTMTFPGIKEYEVFSIVYEPVHGIIYKNSKKEERMMRHSEIHKFCDAILMRVLEGLKSYNNDVKYGYVQKELTSDEVEYRKLFEEETEVKSVAAKMARSKSIYHHTMGRGGYAHVKQKMPNQAVQKINSWIDKETRGLISSIVGNELSPDAVIVLANALYFKGIWFTPFDENLTKWKDFHLINGEIISVLFMTSSSELCYGCFEEFKILKIQYESEEKSNKYSMYIFLPEKKDGLRDLLELFHLDHALFHGKFELDYRKLDKLWIPKFKTVKDAGGFFAWPKNQVVLDPKATPPSTIQMIGENKTTPKLQSKRKNVYVSRDTMQKAS
ncbi:retrovirus-related pol polyprotein from transposon TNT 1-94 [Tanacetum coccineum]|uniref:Retrovirus-related pol polyprotein from transposon TNT 1-94 n=1 Tax=Tanacetum coccineum TaxID=301880 RepID=A0ABQ4ZC69_9ASTR